MIRLRAKKLFKRSSSKASGGGGGGGSRGAAGGGDIQWEVRPGGMLVQKRECGEGGVEMVTVRISTGSNLHDISIGATATFGIYPYFCFKLEYLNLSLQLTLRFLRRVEDGGGHGERVGAGGAEAAVQGERER